MKGKRKKTKTPMKNITINIPEIYDKNIQWLISKKLIVSRSEAIYKKHQYVPVSPSRQSLPLAPSRQDSCLWQTR